MSCTTITQVVCTEGLYVSIMWLVQKGECHHKIRNTKHGIQWCLTFFLNSKKCAGLYQMRFFTVSSLLFHLLKYFLRSNKYLVRWLLIICSPSRSKIFHSPLHRWKAATFLCSTLQVFEQGRPFIVPHLLRHWVSVLRVHPNLIACDKQGIMRTYSNRILTE